MADNIPNFKCIIIGDAATGKTSFIRQFTSASSHSNEHSIIFSTNFGTIAFSIQDTSGEESSGNVEDLFFKRADCAIIFFDVTSKNSYDNVFHWYRRVTSFNRKIPIALVGNNSHSISRKVSSMKIRQDWEPRMRYFEVSLRDKSSVNEPFIFIAQKLLKKGVVLEIANINSEAHINVESLHKLMEIAAETNGKQTFSE